MEIFSEDDYLFWIEGQVISTKNSRKWTGKYFIMSDAADRWIKRSKKQWEYQAIFFQYIISMLPRPVNIELTFVRRTKGEFDYINMAQGVLDLMKKHNWIPDDDANRVKPFFGDYIHDPERPGVTIRIIKEKPILP